MASRNTALSDVTLTMIVRDELMNPAGGLHAMLTHHLPWFEHVVVLDTGSVDGTRQLLEEMAGEYPQLRVYDAQFEGYGPARNTANGYVKTKYTFMLDADERFKDPQAFVDECRDFSQNYLQLNFINIRPSGKAESARGWNPRFFKRDSITIQGTVGEFADFNAPEVDENGKYPKIATAKTPVLHFIPKEENREEKVRSWYSSFHSRDMPAANLLPSPSETASYALWKTPNSRVLKKYGINVKEEIAYLHSLGLQLQPGIEARLSWNPLRRFFLSKVQSSPQTI